MCFLKLIIQVLLIILSTISCHCENACEINENWWKVNQQCENINAHRPILKSNNNNYDKPDINNNIQKLEKGKQSTRVSTIVCNFLAILLLISVIIALFEVCRDRFIRKQERSDSVSNAPDMRRCSLADLTVSRHARRVEHPARLTRDHRSLSVQNRPLLGARPPPLIRRSSFPAVPAPRDMTGSPAAGSTQESNESTPAHRIRLIRRH